MHTTDPSPSAPETRTVPAPASRPLALRVLGGVGGALFLIVAAAFTLGTALAAPIAILIARARARRRQRSLSRSGSWTAAAAGSSIASVVVLSLAFAALPSGTLARMDATADSVRVARAAHPPAWVARLRAMSGQPADPALAKILRSRPAMRYIQLLSGIFACVVLGAISGSLGWVASLLLGYAFAARGGP